MDTLCGEAGDAECERLRDELVSWFDGAPFEVGRRQGRRVVVRWCDGPPPDAVRTAVEGTVPLLEGITTDQVDLARVLGVATFASAVIASGDAGHRPSGRDVALSLVVEDLRDAAAGLASAVGCPPDAVAVAAGPLVAARVDLAVIDLAAGPQQLDRGALAVVAAWESLRAG